jgi:hypothetical protein
MINNDKMDRIFEFINKNSLVEFINEKGDMDNPSTVVKPILDRVIFGK